uniref:Transmembrane protein n=1 Tax=Alexandrium catenella TaxID=2925 RepID=A0A7S1R8Q8_ALECA|mmetsp:Transcript_48147/g.128860  ORF Transcript_48147/g.128860 Transcript_48147/m.128860 type:complete len:220 (+) Transcript_48147:53-712(+)
MLQPSMPSMAYRLLRCCLAVHFAVVLLVVAQTGDEDGPGQQSAEARAIKELKATLRNRGADCHGCETEEDFTRRVAETRGWRADEAVSPDGKIKVTRQQFLVVQRSSQHEGHELDDGDDGDTDTGNNAWVEFRDAMRAGDLVEDGQGGYRKRQAGMTGWRRHAKWALTLVLGICALARRLLGVAPPSPQPSQPKGSVAAPRKAEGGGGTKKSTGGKKRR